VGEAAEGVEAIGGAGAVEGAAQVGWQRPVDVPCDDDAALYVVLFLGPLLRYLLHDMVVDVVVELVEGDVAVPVAVPVKSNETNVML
jgi:hypothetical protein